MTITLLHDRFGPVKIDDGDRCTASHVSAGGWFHTCFLHHDDVATVHICSCDWVW